MSLYDLDDALGINQQNTQSKALGNLVSSHGTNPDDYAKRMQLQKSTGTPAVLMDDPEVKAEAEKQHYMQGLAISHTPATARFAADENHAPMITDDVHNLTGFESKMSDLGKNRQPTLNQMRQVMGVDNKPLSAQRLTGETAKNVFAPVPGLAIDAFAEGMAGFSRLALESKYAPLYYLDQYGVKPVFGGTMAEGAAKLGNYFKERGKATEEAYKLEAPDAQAVRSGLVSVGQMLIPMSAGSKFTAGAKTAEEAAKVLERVVLGTLTAQTTGQSYNKYRDDKGFEPDAAALGAGVEGAIEYGTEKLPVGIISKYLNGMGKRGINGFVTTMAKLGIGEQATEFLATLGQDSTEKIMGTPGMTSEQRTQSLADYFTKEDQDGYTEFIRNARSTAIATATMTVATGGLLPVGARAMESARGKIRQANAEQTQTQLLDALTTAEMSKLKERSPETFANYAQQVADQHGVSSVYFQADKLINAAIQNGVTEQQIPAYLAQYGVTPSQIQEAVHTNGLVELKMGDFVTNFQDDVVLQSLQNDLLIDPNAHAMSEAENGSRLDMEQLQHLNELYQADQGRKINQDDIAAWEDAILATPGLKGKVTSESLLPIIARANVLSQMTDAPAIEHLNRMLQPTGLQAMKFAEFQTRKQNRDTNSKYDIDTIYESLVAEGDKTVLKGKGNSGNWSESEFSKHLQQFYPAVNSLYLMHGHNKTQIMAALKNAKDGKQLNDNHAAIVQAFKDDMDNYASQQTEEDDYPFQRNKPVASPNSRQGSETYSIRKTAAEGMLAPAVLKDGKIMAAGIGATHYDVHTEVGQTEGDNANGFITPDGQFLSRKQSLEWLKKNRPDAYRALDKETKQNGLESQAYAHAEGLGGNLADEAQRYMESMGLFQDQQNTPLGALNTKDGVNLVTLFEKADKSSFLHETAHIFLNDLKYVADTYGVQQKEWQEVQQWLGSTDGTITIEQHEKFAEHFEVYLKEGKAPTVELRNAFRMFKKWLTNIYESVKSGRFGQRELTIAPELSDLFDRLLATEQDIKAAREQDALTEMLDVNLMSEVGDSSSQIEEYRNIINQAEGSAREKMDKHKLVGRDGRLTEWRKQANEESKQVPLYGFIESAIADGGIVRQSVVDLFGEGSVPAMPQLWRNNGNDINVAIAERGADFGYESAGQFIDDIRNMVPRSVWVDKRVAQLESIYDGGLDTQEAIRTAALRRMMEIESEWLAKRAVNKTTTTRAVMRAWADKIVAGRTIGEIKRVDRLLADSRKKRQQAILEARRGNWEQALKANEQARMTEELIASSYRAMKSWQSMQANWKKIAKWTNDNKSVKVGTNYRDQINRLLEQYGIAKKEYDPAAPDLHSFAANMIDELDGTGATLPAWVGVETDDFKKLNWEQLQDLNDALKYLYGNGRDEVQGRKMTNGEYVAEYAANIAALQDGIKNKPDLHSDATEAGKVLKGIQKSYRKFFANTGILRFIAKRMDGYSDSIGPAEQLVQNIINGMSQSNDMWVAISKEIEPQLNILMKDGNKVFTDIPWPELMKREGDSWTKARVVAAALNMGNDSNMMKLLEGYDMTQDHADMIAGKLTAEEWQAIQKIWDAVDSLWPQIVETHEKLKYYRPKKIAARSIEVTTADGQTITLNGGYYPIKYNANLTRKIAAWNEKDDLLASHESIMQVPAAKSGFAKERTGVAYPIDLSLNVLASHLNDTIKFITLSESVRDADRVFQSSVLMDRNLDTLGRDMVNMIRPTLKNVIRPEQNKLGRFFESSRVAMSTFYMGYNAWTALQNVTGVFPAIKQSGFQNYLNGIAHVMSNPLEAHKAMLEASSYMRMREANVERDMKKQMRDFKVGGMEINGKRYTYDDVKSLGFAGIRLIDGIVSLPAWWGKYNAEMEKHGNVQKATEEADATINKALGSGLAIDSTGIGRHPFLSLLAPFMSFASAQQEVLATAGEAHKQGKISSSEFLYTHLMTWLAPSIMSTFMQGVLMYGVVAALGGGDDDKRKKGLMDYATDLISYRLMGIPFMRDMWNSMLQGFEHKAPITSARMPVTEGFKMLQQLGYKIGNLDGSERTTKAAMWSAAELASLFSGIPATRIYDRWAKGTKQIESGVGWWGNHFAPQEKKK